MSIAYQPDISAENAIALIAVLPLQSAASRRDGGGLSSAQSSLWGGHEGASGTIHLRATFSAKNDKIAAKRISNTH